MSLEIKRLEAADLPAAGAEVFLARSLDEKTGLRELKYVRG